MAALSADYATTATKIRALSAAGYSRSDIAGFLGKGYQHVRNVLTQPPPRAGLHANAAPAAGVSESPARSEYAAEENGSLDCGIFQVDDRGRIELSPGLLKALDALPSRRIPWRFEAGELILMSLDAAARDIDRLTVELRRRPGSMADELIAERRAEFEREEREFLRSRTRRDD